MAEFYLPCQAKEPGDSFFHDHQDDGRQPLQPSIWIQNVPTPLVSGPELDQSEFHRGGIDEAAVQTGEGRVAEIQRAAG